MTSSEQIIEKVESFIGYSINWNTRKREHLEPKQIITYLVYKVCELKPPLVPLKIPVGRCVVYHSIKTVESLLLDKKFQIQYRSLFEQFGIEIVDYGFDIKN